MPCKLLTAGCPSSAAGAICCDSQSRLQVIHARSIELGTGYLPCDCRTLHIMQRNGMQQPLQASLVTVTSDGLWAEVQPTTSGEASSSGRRHCAAQCGHLQSPADAPTTGAGGGIGGGIVLGQAKLASVTGTSQSAM